jgi:hypothetical protein
MRRPLEMDGLLIANDSQVQPICDQFALAVR